ncbi:PH domain-containing protein [Nocardioides sp. B-3]|uniref:PH domain-containing protein n=1 Tax=Nocardioides sp. B-3 TaxID=2895565 RepID=UPI0021525EB7|nr:PH domain-containing protein [Nocardioides sp. B-3]UUZ60222.1 PH domain-containing protein [Nocardioides sp. B-3]
MSEQPVTPEVEWQRLSPRNLLIDPVKVLGQFAFPAAVALFGISSGDRGMPWWALPFVVLGAVAFGALPWLTTFYRTTDTQFQIRSGLLNKKTKTAPLDRVRSVDLEASLLHRVVGLTKVQIGTGVDDDRITLDSLTAVDADGLRSFLLSRRAAPAPAPTAEVGTAPAAVQAQEPARVLAEIDWAWLRFAPFSPARLVVLAAAVGALSQFGDQLPVADTAESAWSWVHQFALTLVIAGLFAGGLTSWVLVAVTGYIVQWWNMRLTREAGSLHLTAGLFTTRSITVEEQRVRGVELKEPVLLRLVGGAELSTLATGVGSGGVTAILPPCPRSVAGSVGADVLETDAPMTVRLTAHGPAARRRSRIRQLWGALFVTAVSLAASIRFDAVPGWVPAVVAVVSIAFAALVGESAYRHLGHASTSDHLVVGSGDLTRVRTVLEHDGIIGWVVRQSLFQRRLAPGHAGRDDGRRGREGRRPRHPAVRSDPSRRRVDAGRAHTPARLRTHERPSGSGPEGRSRV